MRPEFLAPTAPPLSIGEQITVLCEQAASVVGAFIEDES
jgi:hypothetical protein